MTNQDASNQIMGQDPTQFLANYFLQVTGSNQLAYSDLDILEEWVELSGGNYDDLLLIIADVMEMQDSDSMTQSRRLIKKIDKKVKKGIFQAKRHNASSTISP